MAMTVFYEANIDTTAIQALDVHVHIDVDDAGHHHALPEDISAATQKYFRNDGFPPLDDIAEYYRSRKMAAVVFTMNARTKLGHEPLNDVEIIAGAARNNDALIPFASVDPLDPARAMDEAKRMVLDHGARGFKFHPSLQGFDPSNQSHYPLYETIEDLGVPCIFHTGQTGVGAGTRGSFGIKLGLSNPMLLDSVAADFPGIDIIMAHPSVPWQDEAISVATHKANVHIDLSGWAPKYFPPQLVQQANTRLSDKVLFGSDFPLLTPDRWLSEFADLPLRDAVRPGILKDNAIRLLGLDATTSHAGAFA
jgi:uncharacterized protein